MAKMWKGTTVYHVLDLNLGPLLYILYNSIDRFILGFPSFPEIQVQCKATANWGWRLRVYLEPIRLRIQTLIANKYCWTSPLLSSTIPAEQQKAQLPPLVHIQLLYRIMPCFCWTFSPHLHSRIKDQQESHPDTICWGCWLQTFCDAWIGLADHKKAWRLEIDGWTPVPKSTIKTCAKQI